MSRLSLRSALSALAALAVIVGMVAPADAATPAGTVSGTILNDDGSFLNRDESIVKVSLYSGDDVTTPVLSQTTPYTSFGTTFTFTGVPSGRYSVKFEPTDHTLVGEWWGDTRRASDRAFVDVTDGGDAVLNVGLAAAVPLHGMISVGTAVGSVLQIEATSGDAELDSWLARTATTGIPASYTLYLLPGTYSVAVTDTTGIMKSKTVSGVVVTAPSISLSFGLEPTDSAAVSISGSMYDSQGAPVAGVYIQALRKLDSGWTEAAASTATAADGSFNLAGLVAHTPYLLFVNWDPDRNGDHSHAGYVTGDATNPTTQLLTRASTFLPDADGITGVRVALEPAGAISGRVVTPAGAPIAGIDVYAYTATDYNDLDNASGYIPMTKATSGADGTFRISGLDYVGDGFTGQVLRVVVDGRSGFVGDDPSTGLVPIDAARRLQAGPVEITGVDIVLPQVRLPADQFILGPRIAPGTADCCGFADGQLMEVGAGTLSVYSYENGALTAPKSIRLGLGGKSVFAPGRWDDLDGNDIITIDQQGDMQLLSGDGDGHLRPPKLIGWGWSPYRVIPVGDITGDHNADLLAIDRSGYLWLYRGDGKGGFLWPPQRVGNGWIGFQLYAAGDLNRDGRADILSIDPHGDLWMYGGNGDGTWQWPRKVGNGWSSYQLAAGADIDGHPNSQGYTEAQGADIVGRDNTTGNLYLYSGNGDGTFGPKKLIATGW